MIWQPEFTDKTLSRKPGAVHTANADVNGARNILAAGHAVLACGEMVQSGRPLKQEPTEMIQATA
ncbi:DNA (cytosine-5-)-methyltransferase [Escherichia coli 2534-86]|nr:hypothetical protein ECRM9131_12880 [Escherichia coli]AWZ57653.1 hypothetical protein ECRM9975_12865 [Escherichia coli]EGW73163.1 DNA (cytosine-5-)-methyltransferase [Escherichia coli 2534-86]